MGSIRVATGPGSALLHLLLLVQWILDVRSVDVHSIPTANSLHVPLGDSCRDGGPGMFHETLTGTCWGVKEGKAEDQRSGLQWCHNVHVESTLLSILY